MTDKRLPVLLSHTRQSPNHVILSMRAQTELVYFDGHFPEIPVVPGVAQIHWAEKLARRFLQDIAPVGCFEKMSSIKFQQLMRPEQAFQLELNYLEETETLCFCYFFKQMQFSTGRLLYQNPAKVS